MTPKDMDELPPLMYQDDELVYQGMELKPLDSKEFI